MEVNHYVIAFQNLEGQESLFTEQVDDQPEHSAYHQVAEAREDHVSSDSVQSLGTAFLPDEQAQQQAELQHLDESSDSLQQVSDQEPEPSEAFLYEDHEEALVRALRQIQASTLDADAPPFQPSHPLRQRNTRGQGMNPLPTWRRPQTCVPLFSPTLLFPTSSEAVQNLGTAPLLDERPQQQAELQHADESSDSLQQVSDQEPEPPEPFPYEDHEEALISAQRQIQASMLDADAPPFQPRHPFRQRNTRGQGMTPLPTCTWRHPQPCVPLFSPTLLFPTSSEAVQNLGTVPLDERPQQQAELQHADESSDSLQQVSDQEPEPPEAFPYEDHEEALISAQRQIQASTLDADAPPFQPRDPFRQRNTRGQGMNPLPTWRRPRTGVPPLLSPTLLLPMRTGGSRAPTAHPPVSEEHITNLPSIQISSDEAQCTVCLETFALGETARQLSCEHCFHGDCITPWLRRSNSCPTCRAVHPFHNQI